MHSGKPSRTASPGSSVAMAKFNLRNPYLTYPLMMTALLTWLVYYFVVHEPYIEMTRTPTKAECQMQSGNKPNGTNIYNISCIVDCTTRKAVAPVVAVNPDLYVNIETPNKDEDAVCVAPSWR